MLPSEWRGFWGEVTFFFTGYIMHDRMTHVTRTGLHHLVRVHADPDATIPDLSVPGIGVRVDEDGVVLAEAAAVVHVRRSVDPAAVLPVPSDQHLLVPGCR